MRKRISLNFDWLFSNSVKDSYLTDYDNIVDFAPINIPHTIKETPYNNFDEKELMTVTCYKKIITIKKEYEGKDINLVFEGIAHKSTIYVNDDFVVIHNGGYDEFVVNITEYVRYGEKNVITIAVDSKENSKIPPFGSFIDFLGYGGIYREAYLEISDQTKIIDFFIRTPDVINSITAYCDLTITTTPVEIVLSVLDGDKEISVNKYNVNREKETIDFDVKNKENWTIENPKLYGINIKMYSDKKLLDEVNGRFAFREIDCNREGFFLNGKQIKLIGLNRLQSFPYVGDAMPKSAQEKDADILKYDLGVNVVRTAHYTQSKHFLNRCDEIGLMVIEEIPGWNYLGDEDFQKNTKENLRNMILRDRNHPSIIMWGTRVSGSQDNNRFYSDLNTLSHTVDPTRPTFGACNSRFNNRLFDVYGYNDYTKEKDGIATKTVHSQYLISEHMGHMFPTKMYDDEMQRITQALKHLQMINYTNNHMNVMGTIGWCFADYNCHSVFGSSDKVCYHGVVDMFRNPKYAGLAYASQKDDGVVMEVVSRMSRGDYKENKMDSIYIFTNCEYVKMFKDDNFVETFYPDKKSFPNLKHPPVVINDAIGQVLERQEKMSYKHSEIIKRIMKASIKKSFKISFINRLRCWSIMRKYGHKGTYIYNLFGKYIIGEANRDAVYRFDGYANENVVKSVTLRDTKSTSIDVTLDKDILTVKDTYDVMRVVVKEIDQDGNNLPYAFTPIHITCEHGIDLIGPSDITLQGGIISFWVKTNQKENIGKITITSNGQVIEKEVIIQTEI